MRRQDALLKTKRSCLKKGQRVQRVRGGRSEKCLRSSYRGKFLNEVVGHVHQILILPHVLLETSVFLLFQEVEVVSRVQQGLDEALPGAQSGHLRGHGRAHPCTDHQYQLGGSLGLQAGQQFPLERAEVKL